MWFFELAGELNSTILEMRRYEKNYFMYSQEFNFEENVTFTNRLAMTLKREKESLVSAIGKENYDHFVTDVENYGSLMMQLHRKECDAKECGDLQALIRGAGQNLLSLGDQFVVAEKRDADRLLKQMIPLPLISLLILLILLVFVIFMIAEYVIRPLARITRESEAVAQGAFQRITPYGESGNEINSLIASLNRMMTELEKRQEQLIQSRKIASIGTLTAGIAHEINNPVNNISLILESLIEDGETMTPEERNSTYREALEQADRTSEIVKNLLEFSRVSKPVLGAVDIVTVVDKTASLLNNEMNLHKVKFSREIQEVQPDIYFDKGGLQQVLLNLFLNSIHAMSGGGELRVVIGTSEMKNESRIDIIDNGPGIAPEHIDQIFDPFFTTKKEGIGTGLGLSVSYNIIKKNGGRMKVESTPGQGACFSLYLPRTKNVIIEG
jgi:two-component system, NtrC family, sensor kinase